MKISTPRGAVLILAALLAASAAASGFPSEDRGPFNPRDLRWKRLEFRAKKFFLTARSVVRLEAVPTAEAASEWIDVPPGKNGPRGKPVGPAGPKVLAVTIESSGVGSDSTNSVWFNPRRADALQRLKMRGHGKKAYRKATRFTDEGTFQRRTAPLDSSEVGRPFAEWSKVEESFYPRPEDGSCPVVSEPSVLFYMLSVRAVDEPQRICVFSGKLIVPVSIETVGTGRVAVSYEEIGPETREHRNGEVEALRVAVRPLAGKDDFELLGLEGGIEIWIEKTSRVPVEVRGRIGGLGGVKVKLTAVELGELALPNR